MATDTIMGPVHPGEILLEEFLKPLPVSQYPPGEGDRGARDRTRTARRGCLERSGSGRRGTGEPWRSRRG
jgi:hypothetical protein